MDTSDPNATTSGLERRVCRDLAAIFEEHAILLPPDSALGDDLVEWSKQFWRAAGLDPDAALDDPLPRPRLRLVYGRGER